MVNEMNKLLSKHNQKLFFCFMFEEVFYAIMITFPFFFASNLTLTHAIRLKFKRTEKYDKKKINVCY